MKSISFEKKSMERKILLLSAIILLLNVAHAFGQCGGATNQDGHVGFFDDGSGGSNYGDNVNCSWQFYSTVVGQQVRIGFYNFDLEPGYDFVRIYDGPDATYPLIAELTGSSDIQQYYTTSQWAFVTFTTDGSVGYPGFQAFWDSYYSSTTQCSNNIGVFSSDYVNNVTYRWVIEPQGAEKVKLDIFDIDMESCCDFVRVYDGTSSSAPLIGQYTGTNPVYDIIANSGRMYIEFQTDVSVNNGGFSASYSCITCEGITTLTEPIGTAGDGSDFGTHGNNLDCAWLIDVPGANRIEIDFTFMELESCCDFVTIYDGTNANAPLIATVTGFNTQQDIITTNGQAFVRFTTDGSVTNLGWSLNYSANIPCTSNLTTLSSCTGTVTDGSDGLNYANNANCRWLISPQNAQIINFNFSQLDLETGLDFLRIYDGYNSNAPLILNATGNSIPVNLSANSGSAYIEFTSNATNAGQGFSLDYSCSLVGIEDILSNYEVKIFPNPTNGLITLELNTSNVMEFNVEIFDFLGRQISNNTSKIQSLGNSISTIDLSNEASGIYFISLTNDTGVSKRFRVQKIEF